MKGNEGYKKPIPVEFMGGAPWGIVAAGILGLVLANVAATQCVAAYFEYQPDLGPGLFRSGTQAIYQPFSWAVWCWKFGGSADPLVRRAVMLGTFGAMAALVLVMLMVAALNTHRMRRLSRDTEHLHGSARFANPEDIKNTGLLEATEGVYVGGWYDAANKRLRYLRHNGPEHVLAFAPTRSGKGVGLVIPTLLAWNESAVIYDIKGENWQLTAGFRAAQGHVCFKFSPIDRESSSRFNPLAEVRIFTERDVADAHNIADILVRTDGSKGMQQHWQDTAVSLMTGMILHVCYAAATEGKTACLADIGAVLTRPGVAFSDTMAELLVYKHDPHGTHGWKLHDGPATATHPVVAEKIQEFLDKDNEEQSGVLSSTKITLMLYSDPMVARATSTSDFRVNDLINYERPVSLYLVVPPSDADRLAPLIRLIFTTIVSRLVERMDFGHEKQKLERHRLLFLIDEFPSLKQMPLFANALSYMAGYGLKAFLITQDIRQIVKEYGHEESIVSNCHTRIAFAPNQYETAELLSKMAGKTTIQKAHYSFSGKKNAAGLGQVAASVENIERSLLTPEEILRLKPPEKQATAKGERIVAPGDMLIFVSGHHVIYGRQMLYFSHPILEKRAAIAPPTAMVSLIDGQVQPQGPVGESANGLSAVEKPPSGAAAPDDDDSPYGTPWLS